VGFLVTALLLDEDRMIKQSSDIISQPDGSIVKVTKFSCGPFRSCDRCPSLIVVGDEEQKMGLCSFHQQQLSDEGEYPKNCKIIRVTLEEQL